MLIEDIYGSRINYELVKQTLSGMNFNVYNHTLRLEQFLEPNKTNYTFQISEQDGNPLATEIRLNRNDLFYIAGICVALQKIDSDNVSRYPVLNYPDIAIFSGDNTTNLVEHEALETVYNGQMTFTTSSVEKVRDMNTNQFRSVPETQGVGAGVGTAFSYTTYPEGELYFIPSTPMNILDGSKDNKIAFTLGGGDTAVIDGNVDSGNNPDTRRNKLIIFLAGWRVDDGSLGAGRVTRP